MRLLLVGFAATSSTMFLRLWSLLVFVYVAACTEVTRLEYNVTWVNRSPDGLHNRPVIGVNGQWPIPALHVTKGEQLAITVRNDLGNETTSLHWHGLYMEGASHMDGPPGVTQCEIPPGESFVYEFQVSYQITWTSSFEFAERCRSTSRGHTGSTRTPKANIPMDFALR